MKKHHTFFQSNRSDHDLGGRTAGPIWKGLFLGAVLFAGLASVSAFFSLGELSQARHQAELRISEAHKTTAPQPAHPSVQSKLQNYGEI